MMKCMMCAKETGILTENQVCPDCDKRYFSTGSPGLDPNRQEPPQLVKPRIIPRTILGMLATILTLLTIGVFAFILLSAKTALFLTEGVAVLTTVPAIISTLLLLIASRVLHDRSKIVKVMLIISSILALLSIPVAMAIAAVLPPGSLLPGGFW
jgi:hypothetical protein